LKLSTHVICFPFALGTEAFKLLNVLVIYHCCFVTKDCSYFTAQVVGSLIICRYGVYSLFFIFIDPTSSIEEKFKHFDQTCMFTALSRTVVQTF